MAEVIKLEQDNLIETTRITVNLVQILTLNTLCEGRDDIAGMFQSCRPTKGIQIIYIMKTHVEYVNYITAEFDSYVTMDCCYLLFAHYILRPNLLKLCE